MEVILKFAKYFSTQALDEGFTPNEKPGEAIFYRTDDWIRYKEFKGHTTGKLTAAEISRYDRLASEISKLMKDATRVLSLGGGTGLLEKRLARYLPNTHFIVSDIYDRAPVPEVTYINLDMTDTEALQTELSNIDTILIVNALSPLCPDEIQRLFGILKQSEVNNIIVYSAEDLRLIGYINLLIKRFLLRRRTAMWIGYLYSSYFISNLVNSGFKRIVFYRPKQHGILTPIWGSIYLAKYRKR